MFELLSDQPWGVLERMRQSEVWNLQVPCIWLSLKPPFIPSLSLPLCLSSKVTAS